MAYTSKRWVFPNYYYKKQFTKSNVTVDVVFFDTVIATKASIYDDDDDDDDDGMSEPEPLEPGLAEKQWDWLMETLNASTAEYLLVVGHFALWSIGENGPSSFLIDNLRPHLERVGAHYLAGHDHTLGHIEDRGVHYIISGAGAECCYLTTHEHLVPENSVKFWAGGPSGMGFQTMPVPLLSGFASVHLTKARMAVTFHAHDGTVLYTTPDIPPREAHLKFQHERRRRRRLPPWAIILICDAGLLLIVLATVALKDTFVGRATLLREEIHEHVNGYILLDGDTSDASTSDDKNYRRGGPISGGSTEMHLRSSYPAAHNPLHE